MEVKQKLKNMEMIAKKYKVKKRGEQPMISHGYSDVCSTCACLICSLPKDLFLNLPKSQKCFLCILRTGSTVLLKLFRLDTTRPDYSIRTQNTQSFPSFCKFANFASFVYFKVLI